MKHCYCSVLYHHKTEALGMTRNAAGAWGLESLLIHGALAEGTCRSGVLTRRLRQDAAGRKLIEEDKSL